MASKKDLIFDVDSWRTECPREAFKPILDDLRGTLPRQLARVPPKKIRSWLTFYESKKAALVSQYPELEHFHSPDFETPEEQNYALCNLFIPLLRLEIAQRGLIAEPGRARSVASAPSVSTPRGGSPGSKGGRGWYESDQDILLRRQIVLKNPRFSAKSLCKLFDAAPHPIPLPRDWQAQLGVKTWSEAYANKKSRNRVQKIISTDKRTGNRPGRT